MFATGDGTLNVLEALRNAAAKGSPIPLDLWTICEKSLAKKPAQSLDGRNAGVPVGHAERDVPVR